MAKWLGILLCVVFFISTSYAFGETYFKFDQPVVILEHSTIIVYRNDITDGQLGDIRDAVLNIGSNQIPLTLTETDVDGMYTSPILTFTTGTPDVSHYIFQVTSGTQLTATLNADGSNWSAGPISVVSTDTASQEFRNRQFLTTFPQCGNDVDRDGICDEWEKGDRIEVSGYPVGSTVRYTFLCTADNPCNVDVEHPDIFIAIDFMKGHRPNEQAIQQIINSFTQKGVRAHIQVDEFDYTNILHKSCTTFPGSNYSPSQGFDQIKARFFFDNDNNGDNPGQYGVVGSTTWLHAWHQKRAVFHYVLFVHSICGTPGSSGSAELLGNDVIVSLGSFDRGIGNIDQQAGTTLHEIGHNLNLRHGGFEDKNCKPLYTSVMNYAYQFKDLVASRPLSYSSFDIKLINAAGETSDLNEDQLDENLNVISITPQQQFTYGPIAPIPLPWTGSIDGVDWNNNRVIEGAIADIAGLDDMKDSQGTSLCPNTTIDLLKGSTDWGTQIMKFDSKGTSNYMDGRQVENVNVESNVCLSTEQFTTAVRLGLASENDPQRKCINGVGFTHQQRILLKYEFALMSLAKLTDTQPFSTDQNFKSSLDELSNAINVGKWKDARIILQEIRKSHQNNSDIVKIVNNSLKRPYVPIFKNENELTDSDVTSMRLSRIVALQKFIESLPEDNFKDSNKVSALKFYNTKFDEIGKLILNKNMGKAVDKLIEVRSTFDGDDDHNDERVIEQDAQSSLFTGTTEILESYATAINDPSRISHASTSTIRIPTINIPTVSP
ncbi:MAG: hypothetical protein QW177_00395 [Candidatus Nitrosotenuis sp.]